MNEANDTGERILKEEQDGGSGRKRKYMHFTPKQRVKKAKYAVECDNTVTVRYFSEEFPTLGESIVRL